MELVKLGKKGQITIPRSVLRSAGLDEDATLMVETTEDGAITLRPVAVYPIEIYSEHRIAEFEATNAVPETLRRKVERLIAGQ